MKKELPPDKLQLSGSSKGTLNSN